MSCVAWDSKVDFSKLKLDVYDFLGIILPGLIAVAEGWILLRGWDSFIESMSHISGTSLTLLLVFAFGVGHLVQELADTAIRLTKGPRYLLRARDKYWRGKESESVKKALRKELGHELTNVDDAYDFCLTKVRGHFDKRDIFVATSDLSRSFVAMGFLAVIPAAKIAFWDIGKPLKLSLEIAGVELALLAVIVTLAWRRMMRFRALAEITVFRVYLAVPAERNSEAKQERHEG
jgi:hypothetical protein